MDDDFERTPPHDMAAEQCALGGMLLSKDAISDVIGIIRPADHYRPAHQLVHEAVLGLYARGEPADAITVADELTRRGEIAKVGGAVYLHTLIAAVPTAASAGYYARIVAGKAAQRRVIEAGSQVTRLGWAPGELGSGEMVARAQEVTFALSRDDSGAIAPLADILYPAIGELEDAAAGAGKSGTVLTGFQDLDSLLHGLHQGQMIIIAGRPGHGKSTLALDFARHAAIRQNRPAALFSLEMGRTEIIWRLLSAECRIPLHAMRGGTMSDDDWTRLAIRAREIRPAPLWIDDSPAMTLMDIRARSRQLAAREDLGMVIIDYLQLLTSAQRAENRQQEVSGMSRSIKLLAKELGVPVIALSQLNRGPEQRADKRPVLADLRESGSLEQDSDVVILLHRDDVYESETPRAGEADLIVAKHRNGPTATVVTAFQGHYSRFVDMAAG